MKKRLLLCPLLLSTCLIISSCGHEHTWKDATCTEPKTCTECGETEGEPLGHSWTEATCTDPKTCTVCGETEGEPLGHSTDMGICSICGKMVNSEEFSNLINDIQNVKMPEADNIKGNTVEAMYSGCIKVYEDACSASDEFQKIVDKYGSYEGASDIIEKINAVIKAKPSKPSKTKDSEMQFFDDMADFMLKYKDLTLLMASELDKLLSGAGY